MAPDAVPANRQESAARNAVRRPINASGGPPLETTLHRELKLLFALPDARLEARVDGFRIDVVNGDRLVEIQHSGLSAIRDKVRRLLAAGHLVEVVKPLVTRKRLVMLDGPDGQTVSQRWSPLRGDELSLFDELLHFATVFPHPGLTLVAPLVQVEEIRYPGHGRRRRCRRGDWQVQDRRLIAVEGSASYRRASDLHALLPGSIPSPFNTADLARSMEIPRWRAQQIAWVLARTGAATACERTRAGVQYRLEPQSGGRRAHCDRTRKSRAA